MPSFTFANHVQCEIIVIVLFQSRDKVVIIKVDEDCILRVETEGIKIGVITQRRYLAVRRRTIPDIVVSRSAMSCNQFFETKMIFYILRCEIRAFK